MQHAYTDDVLFAKASITGTTQGVAYSATQAALTAAITLANNKGDIGKTLQDMGKSENIKSIITSAVTAGALQSINPDWMQQLSKSGQFTDKAVINLTNAAVSATIKTAIQGGSYEDNLAASLKTAGLDTVAGWAASNVGQGYKNGEGALSELQGQYIAHKVAHALVGCASAAAKDSSCAAGCASGAVTGAGCEKGATTAAVLSTAGETYQSLVGYAANAGPGENKFGTKLDGSSTGNGTYEYNEITGQQLPSDRGMNVIGLNKPGSVLSQGGTISRALNQVPFVNATAGLHDYIFNANQDLNFTHLECAYDAASGSTVNSSCVE